MKVLSLSSSSLFGTHARPVIETSIVIGNEFKKYTAKSSIICNSLTSVDPETEVKNLIASINTFFAKALHSKNFNSIEKFDEYLKELSKINKENPLNNFSTFSISAAFFKAFVKSKKLHYFELVSELSDTVSVIPVIFFLEPEREIEEVNEQNIIKKEAFNSPEGYKVNFEAFNTVSQLLQEVNSNKKLNQQIYFNFTEDFSEEILFAHILVGTASDIAVFTLSQENFNFIAFNEILRITKLIEEK